MFEFRSGKFKIITAVLLLSGSFLFLGNVKSTFAFINSYTKPYNGTLTAAEWNNLSSDFLNKSGGATMTGPLGIGTSTPASGLWVNGPIYGTNFAGGAFTGFVDASNVMGGSGSSFGSASGGGNYSFPANLGIGTTNPFHRLQISGANSSLPNTSPFGIVKNEEGYGLFFGIEGNGNSWLQSATRNNSIKYNLTLQPQGGNTILNPTAGSVGIGTTNPQADLDVNGLIKMRTSSITQSEDVINKGYLDSALASSSGAIITQIATSSFWAGSLAGNVWNANAGNIGVGTSSPSSKLHISGSSATGDLTVSNFSNAGSISVASLLAPAGTADMYFSIGNALSTANAGLIGFHKVSAGSSSNYAFLTTHGRPASDFIVNGLGNVGIGTTAPNAKLDVKGSYVSYNGGTYHYKDLVSINNRTSSVTGTLKISMPKTWSSTMMTTTIKGYNYSTNGAWEVIVSGYNYTSPSWINTSVEIRGKAPFSSVRLAHDGTTNVILLGTVSTVWSYPTVDVTDFVAGFGGETGWGSGWAMSFITDESTITNVNTPTSPILINTAGNVGIGVTTVNDKFTIGNGGSAAPAGSANTGHNYTSTYLATDNYALANYGLVKTLVANATTSLAAAIGLWSGVDNGNIWNGDSGAGSVGIGTTNPGYKLDVAGDIRANNDLYVAGPTDRARFIYLRYRSDSWPDYSSYIAQTGASNIAGTQGLIINENIGNTSSNYGINLAIASSSKLFIQHTGNVGIGTTNPYGQLAVAGHLVANIASNSPTDSAGDIKSAGFGFRVSGSTVLGALINATEQTWGADMNFNVRGSGGGAFPATPAMIIKTGGNVGIGVTTVNDKFTIGNGGSGAPAGSANTGHNYTSTYLSTDDYALANYGLVKTLVANATSSLVAGNLWNGALNGNIYNGTAGAGNVGIGTTTPTTGKLVVVGDIDLPNTNAWRYIKNSANNGGLRLGTSNASGTYLDGIEISAGGGYVKLNHNTTVTGNLYTTGNVGIGTTTPGAKLDIFGSNNAMVLGIKSNSGQIQFFPYSDGKNYIESTNAAGTASQLLYFTGYSGAAGTFAFNGNVGIGATTLNDKFTIGNGGSAAPAGSANTGHNFTSTYLATDDYALTNYGLVKTLVANATSSLANAIGLWSGTDNGNIWNGDAGAGNVGIGTTNPNFYKLNVAGRIISTSTSLSVNSDSVATEDPTSNLLYKSGATNLANVSFTYGTKTYLGNGKYRFVNTSGAAALIRFNTNLSDLTNGGTYAVGINYENLSGAASIDWCDSVTTGVTSASSGSGRLYGTAARGTYDNTYRFFDVQLGIGASVDLYAEQVEYKNYATSFVPGDRNAGDLIIGGKLLSYYTNNSSFAGNVGIGTTAPTSLLEVAGQTGASAGLKITGSGAQALEIRTSSNAATYIDFTASSTSNSSFGTPDYGGRIIYNNIANSMQFAVNGAYKAILDSNGNLGVGTTNPGQKLDVSGNIVLSAANGKIYLPQTPTTFNWIGDSIEQTGFVIDPTNNGTSERISFYTNNFERMRIDANGEVGIGTTAPNDALSIGNAGAAPAGSSKTGHNFTSTYLATDDYALANYGLVKTLVANATSSLVAGNLWNGTLNGNIYNGTAGAGNVGIGTTNPLGKLHIGGDGYALYGPNSTWNSTLRVGGNGNVTTDASVATTNGNLHLDAKTGMATYINFYHGAGVNFGNGGGSSIVANINSTGGGYFLGNVGIGTTSPQKKLHVVGDIGISDANQIQFLRADNSVNSYISSTDGSGITVGENRGAYTTIMSLDNDKFLFSTGSAGVNTVLIDTNGNVGIGTTAPNDTLSIGNAGAAPAGSSKTGHNFTSTYLATDDYALANYGLVKTLVANATSSLVAGNLWNGALNGNIYNGTAGAGNVGIGTNNPLFKTEIDTSASALFVPALALSNPYATDASGQATGILFNTRASSGGIRYKGGIAFTNTGDYGRGSLAFLVNNTSNDTNAGLSDAAMTILSSGNVGIGTTTPAQKLQVVGGNIGLDNNRYLTWKNNSSGVYDGEVFLNTSNQLELWSGTGDAFIFKSNNGGAEWMRINSGNVGIGTTTPTSKLYVNGEEKIANGNLSLDEGRAVVWRLGASDTGWSTGSIDTTSYKMTLKGHAGFNFITNQGNSPINAMSILTGGNVGIGTTAPNDTLSIGNAGAAPAGSSKTGHNFTSTYLATDDYALANYGLVKTLVANATSSLASAIGLWSGTDNGNIWNGDAGAGNVGIGTNNPGAKLDVNGNIKTNNQLITSGAVTVYRNVVSAQLGGSPVTGAFVIHTNITIPKAIMFELKLRGFFYDGTAPFEINGSGYIYTNTVYGHGYTNTSNKKLSLRYALDSNNKVIFILGDVTDTFAYPKIIVDEFWASHGSATDAEMAGWTITQETDLSPYTVTAVVADKTAVNASSVNAGTFQNGVYAFPNAVNFAGNGTWSAVGNVGIGTNVPNDIFSIGNSGSAPIGSSKTGHNYTSTYLATDDYALANYGLVKTLVANATSSLVAGNLWNGTLNGNIYNGTAGAGNVGIGTTNPLAIFQVGNIATSFYGLTGGSSNFISTNLGLSETSMGTINVASNSKTGSATIMTGYGPSITFTQNVSQYVDGYEKVIGGIKSYLTPTGNTNPRSSLGFFTHNDSSLLERMTIDYLGNVGIGTTNPNDILTISSPTQTLNAENPIIVSQVPGYTRTSGIYNTIDTVSGLGTGILFKTYKQSVGAYNAMKITHDGNVGIGTTAPGGRLAISKGSESSVPALGTSSTFFNVTVGNSYGLIGGVLGSGNAYLQAQRIDATATAYNLLLNPNGGNVGIGVTTVNDKFTIGNGGSGAPAGSANTGHNYTSTYLSTDDYALANYGLVKTLVANATSSLTSVIGLWSGNKNGNIWNGDLGVGNVGIGTTNPFVKLEIAGALKIGDTSDTCDANHSGAIRYNSTSDQSYLCNGSRWINQNNCGLMTDDAGQSYGTVQIGGQCWMAENINIGTMLAAGTTEPTTTNNTIEKWCYSNSSAQCAANGGLYNWDEAMRGSQVSGARGICPSGWHIPSDAEYNKLEKTIVGIIGSASAQYACNMSVYGWQRCADNSGTDTGGTYGTGKSLKAVGQGSGVGAGNDLVGFNGNLLGYRATDGSYTTGLSFWSSTPSGTNAWDRSLISNYSTIGRFAAPHTYGLSVRCIRD